MKISYKHLLEFIQPKESLEEICNLLTNSGLEVEGIEEFESVKGSLKGLVTGLVVSREKHPNADKLSLTKVDIGTGELLSIVCGAPNVDAGQKVIVAPVGCTIFPLKGESFTIGKAKIRGEASEGMICAEDEIGIGESHDGILVLPRDTPIGIPAVELFEITQDSIVEIGLTANRGDAASHLGIAREIGALLNIGFDFPITPNLSYPSEKPFNIQLKEPEFCPRYSGLLIENIKVQDSPDWLKSFLKSIGINPKNNIVDITNFVMHSIGQPLHAFDANKISGKTIEVKKAVAGNTFVSLDQVERKLSGEELMIWDAEKPLAIAGVIGGQNSSVSEQTTSIFIESAYFEPGIVRKSAKTHALNTDSSFRFERGTNPDITKFAIGLAAHLILENGGGTLASAIMDQVNHDFLPQRAEILLRKSQIKRICGIEIPDEKVAEIVTNLGMQILRLNNEGWELSVPAFKSDVTREIDVIEEIIRIYGFENIPLNEKMNASLPKPLGHTDRFVAKKEVISNYLRAHGFHEMQANSMVKEKYFNPETDGVISLKNPLSGDMGVMRQSLIPGALESIAYNQKRRAESILLFEFGKSYTQKEAGKYAETNLLCISASGSSSVESWEQKPKAVDYFFMKRTLTGLAKLLAVNEISEKNGLLTLGKPDSQWMKISDCKEPLVVAEINLDKLIKASLKFKFTPQELPKFPTVRRDLSLVIDKAITFDQISEISRKTERKYLTDMFVFDVYEGKPLDENKKSYSIAFMLYDTEKTMSDKQIDSIMEKLMLNFEKEIGASIRK